MKDILADRTALIDASGIRKVFALADTLENPVNLSIGQPDFDVPEPLKDRAINAIRQGHNKYSMTAGDPELRERLTRSVEERFGWDEPPVLVTSGVSGALLLAFNALINPGDEVIIPDPYFVIYKHIINMLGGKCVFVDTYPDFQLPIDKIEDLITEKTKLIVINSPCNPTGTVYSRQQLEELARIASAKDLLVMTDEIYDKFSYDGPCPTIADYYPNVLLIKGFSKTFAMTGWRLAYAVVPNHLRDILEQMTKIQQYTFVCAPTPFQKAAIAALDYDVTPMVDAYRKKRDLVYEGLKDKFELSRPAGAFYAFVKAPGKSAADFVEKAIKNNLLIIPGNVFSEKDTHFRISYANSNEKIRQGLEILRKIA